MEILPKKKYSQRTGYSPFNTVIEKAFTSNLTTTFYTTILKILASKYC